MLRLGAAWSNWARVIRREELYESCNGEGVEGDGSRCCGKKSQVGPSVEGKEIVSKREIG